MTQTERDLDAGLWVPMYYGNRFKVCRLVGKLRTQEESNERFRTLEEARAECVRRNGRDDYREQDAATLRTYASLRSPSLFQDGEAHEIYDRYGISKQTPLEDAAKQIEGNAASAA